MLDHSQNLAIFGGTFRSTHTTYIGAKEGFDRLEEQVAHRAFHNSGEHFDNPKCHPRTRVAVLERIMEWIWGREDRDALIMWLYGPAGAGKSSIAQSIAEKCHELGLLLATFFFSKSDASRNTLHPLIPTLAYQVALHIPEARECISAAILNDPLIFTKSLPTQMESVLIKPLLPLVNSGYFSNPSSRRLVIIDGLDECHNPQVQQKLVEQISNALKARNVPLIFLVASRPEVHLSITFNLPAQTLILTRLALDDHYKPEEDIHVYLNDSFEQIRSTHPRKDFIPDSWPSPDKLKTLVYKASGQFIYAATVVKYVQSLQHSPVHRLKVILGLQPPHNDRPFAELDALYTEIFLALDDPRPVLQILGFVDISSLWISNLSTLFRFPETIANFFDLKSSDILGYMSNIRALVTLIRQLGRLEIVIHHKSLMEFLQDPSRAGTLYLNPGVLHAQIVHRFLQLIQRDRIPPGDYISWSPDFMLTYVTGGLVPHINNACMTEELLEGFIHLSIPKFVHFFLFEYGHIGMGYEALEAFEALGNRDVINIPDLRPSFQRHLLKLLEPYFSHPKLTSLWILAVDPWNMCTLLSSTLDHPILIQLLQLDESLFKIDEAGFRFTSGELGWSRSVFQHLKSVVPPTVVESRGTILATLALHFLEFLCNESFPQITQLRKSKHDSRMMRNASWTWRRRFVAIKPFWSKKNNWLKANRPEAPKWGLGSLRCHRPDVVYQRESLSNLVYVLDHLPVLLKHADKNDNLISFASQHIFPQQAFRFPRLRKRAQKAVNAYLAKFPSDPPAITIPEYSCELPSNERLERKPGSPWHRIFDLFPYFLAAVLEYIYFLWVTCFA